MIDFIILVLIMLVILCCANIEHFNGGPSNSDKDHLIESALSHAEVFDPYNGQYLEAKHRIPNLDNVIYEDFRKLKRAGKFNRENMMAVLST